MFSARTLLGVLIEIFVADLLTVLGLSGQKHAFSNINSDAETQTTSQVLWLLSFVIFMLGQATEGIALILASQSYIAAVSNLALVWSAFIAYFFFDETFNVIPPLNDKVNADGNQSSTPAAVDSDGSESLRMLSRLKVILVDLVKLIYMFVVDGILFIRDCIFAEVSISKKLELLAEWDFLSYGALIVGSIITVVATPEEPDASEHENADEFLLFWFRSPFILFDAALLFISYLLYNYLSLNWDKRNRKNALALAFLGSFLSGVTGTLSKVFLTIGTKIIEGEEILRSSSTFVRFLEVMLYPCLFLIWLGTMVGSIAALNVGLVHYEQRLVLPVFEIVGSVCTILSGIFFYRLYNLFTFSSFFWFSFGVILMSSGIVLVSFRESSDKDKSAERNGDFSDADSKTALLPKDTP